MKNLYYKVRNGLAVILIAAVVTSCTLEKQLPGVWQISSYTDQQVDGSATTATNVGTIEFNEDGTGSNDLEFKVFGSTTTDQKEFNYTLGEDYVTIKPRQRTDSLTVKTWLVMDNTRNSQKWKSTDNEGNIQTLELKKK